MELQKYFFDLVPLSWAESLSLIFNIFIIVCSIIAIFKTTGLERWLAIITLICSLGLLWTSAIKDKYAAVDGQKIKQELATRTIPKDVRSALILNLSSVPAEVERFIALVWMPPDTEAQSYLNEIQGILKQANWEVKIIPLTAGNSPIGVGIPGPENSTVLALRKAFDDAGVDYTIGEPSGLVKPMSVIKTMPNDIMYRAPFAPGVIIVGAKARLL